MRLYEFFNSKIRSKKKKRLNKTKKKTTSFYKSFEFNLEKFTVFFFILNFFCFSLTCWIKITFTIVSHELQVVLSIFFTLSFYKEHSFIFQKTKKTKSF